MFSRKILVQQPLCIWYHGRSFEKSYQFCVLPTSRCSWICLATMPRKFAPNKFSHKKVGLDGDESDWYNPYNITIPKQVSKLGKLGSFDFPNSTSSNSQFVQNIPKIQKNMKWSCRHFKKKIPVKKSALLMACWNVFCFFFSTCKMCWPWHDELELIKGHKWPK